MVEHHAQRIAVRAAIIVVRFAEEAAPVEMRADGMAAPARNAILVQMIVNHGKAGDVRGAPG